MRETTNQLRIISLAKIIIPSTGPGDSNAINRFFFLLINVLSASTDDAIHKQRDDTCKTLSLTYLLLTPFKALKVEVS